MVGLRVDRFENETDAIHTHMASSEPPSMGNAFGGAVDARRQKTYIRP